MLSTVATPTSPITASRKRHSLGLVGTRDSTSTLYSNETTFSPQSSRTSHSSHTSMPSQRSPTTPRPTMFVSSPSSPSAGKYFLHHRRPSSQASSIHSNRNVGEQEELGSEVRSYNLADELGGECWDEDGRVLAEEGSGFLEGLREGSVEPPTTTESELGPSPNGWEKVHDMGPGVMADFQCRLELHPSPLSSSIYVNDEVRTRRDSINSPHQRHRCQHGGSDHADRFELEDVSGLPPRLTNCLREVESVTRSSLDDNGDLSEDGGVVQRTTRALKELRPQSSIENGCTRLITAYTSMAMHRTHKTRELFSQAHPLLYGSILHLPEDIIDILLDEITMLSSVLPFTTQQNPLLSLHILATDTATLLTHLRHLTDTLQESRVASSAATRRLKSVRDMSDEMRLEHDLTETSIMLIQAGDWDRRCRERQAAQTCREVLRGFTETMTLARERWVRGCQLDRQVSDFGCGDEVALAEVVVG